MHPRTPNCVLFSTHTKLQSIYLFKGALNCQNLEKLPKNWFFPCVTPGHRNVKNIDLVHLHWKLRLLYQIYTMYILKHYFKPENKTDNCDFTKFVIKIGPVPDLQELPCVCLVCLGERVCNPVLEGGNIPS